MCINSKTIGASIHLQSKVQKPLFACLQKTIKFIRVGKVRNKYSKKPKAPVLAHVYNIPIYHPFLMLRDNNCRLKDFCLDCPLRQVPQKIRVQQIYVIHNLFGIPYIAKRFFKKSRAVQLTIVIQTSQWGKPTKSKYVVAKEPIKNMIIIKTKVKIRNHQFNKLNGT